jgi:hypothetical protein
MNMTYHIATLLRELLSKFGRLFAVIKESLYYLDGEHFLIFLSAGRYVLVLVGESFDGVYVESSATRGYSSVVFLHHIESVAVP